MKIWKKKLISSSSETLLAIPGRTGDKHKNPTPGHPFMWLKLVSGACRHTTDVVTCLVYPSIHPMALQPKLGLGLLYLLPPQCSIISGQLPIATTQKSGSILLHHISPSLPGLSNWSFSSKLSFKHFLRNLCASHPLDMSCSLKPFPGLFIPLGYPDWNLTGLRLQAGSLSSRLLVYKFYQAHNLSRNLSTKPWDMQGVEDTLLYHSKANSSPWCSSGEMLC
jgi:hypothetical protein